MTIFHIHHSAGGFTRHFNFVGDDHLGNIRFCQLTNDADDLCRNFRVQCGGRFIEQQYLRFHHQRTGNSNTLLLTTRKMQRVTIAIRFETQTFQQFFCTGQRLIFTQPQYTAGRFNQVLLHGQMRPQVVLLKHHANVTTQIANRFVRGCFGEIEMVACNVERTGAWHLKQIEYTQQRAFTRAAGAK
ncbi:Uncharacterised protein [Shigella sonnei]|uniref:Uncharacterized protein n=1 Tax=Shigella sonnei TaxID=624 RepID=A0A8B4CH48_SHISO|nr:Uncharacterised protein [Shigella sonnei]SIX96209.1 Uncharacterised protein [Shigella sonnei]